MLTKKAKCNADLFVFISEMYFLFSGEDVRHSKLLDKFDHGSVGSI